MSRSNGSARRWQLEYGTTSGYPKNPRNGRICLARYMDDHSIRHANVWDRETGKKVADVYLSGAWGFQIVPVRSKK
jgi:hypothetical protein